MSFGLHSDRPASWQHSGNVDPPRTAVDHASTLSVRIGPPPHWIAFPLRADRFTIYVTDRWGNREPAQHAVLTSCLEWIVDAPTGSGMSAAARATEVEQCQCCQCPGSLPRVSPLEFVSRTGAMRCQRFNKHPVGKSSPTHPFAQREGRMKRVLSAFLVWSFALMPLARAQSQLPPPAPVKVDYEKDVKPLLAQNCYSCHGDTVQQSGLRLDLRQNAL